MSVPVAKGDGHRHSLAQRAVGISHHNAQTVDQIGAQIRGLDGLRREFSARRDKTDFAVIGLIRPAVGIEQHFLSRLRLAEIFLVNIGADPHRMR
jgi:hypothetical protein